MDSEMLRALLAVILRGQEVGRGKEAETDDYYLGWAQQILESSYRNYDHVVRNLDR